MSKIEPTKAQKKIIAETLEEFGFQEDIEKYKLLFTDPSTKQIAIEIAEGKWLYSERRIDPIDRKITYIANVGDINDYSQEEQEGFVKGYYENLKEVKRLYQDDWKMIVIECAFEQDVL